MMRLRVFGFIYQEQCQRHLIKPVHDIFNLSFCVSVFIFRFKAIVLVVNRSKFLGHNCQVRVYL